MTGGTSRHVVVVGAGWSGLAAAVRLVQHGLRVSVREMAPHPGGRARSLDRDGQTLDNGQHILIGAYTETLALMRHVDADPDVLLRRLPLTLRRPGQCGLQLPPGPAVPAFVRGVLACSDWSWADRLALLRTAAAWALKGFRCTPTTTVAQLCRRLPARVREDLIEPLCVAALNTPAAQASGEVLLRVLHDALFSGRGAADLLLPRAPLSQLLPGPALDWLQSQGASVQLGRRVQHLQRTVDGWAVDGDPAHGVVLAASAAESARLAAGTSPRWAACATALAYEPIVTVYADAPDAQLEAPMLALPADDHQHPAQFVFDLGALGGPAGRLAFVTSGAAPWLAAGRKAIEEATLVQARAAWPSARWVDGLTVRQVLYEKRATFRCTPDLQRPSSRVTGGLWAAGDHVAGPYPATLEGAVRSGLIAAEGVITELA